MEKADPRDRYFKTEILLPAPIEDVFDFFSDAKNLERITPDFLHFKVLDQSTPQIQDGTVFNYRLKIRGIPVHWQSRIEQWRPLEQFADTQLRGPYQKWYHLHSFERRGAQTFMKDEVIYRLPLGYLGDLFAGRWVDRDVRNIFAYRSKVISEIFSAP